MGAAPKNPATPGKIKKALWVEAQMADGTVYRVPAKRLSNNDTDEQIILRDANKKTWHEVKQFAVVCDRAEIDGDLWQNTPKKIVWDN